MKKNKIKTHAPNITLTAEDYTFTNLANSRIRTAKRGIKAFLRRTKPDSLNPDFYDKVAEADDEMEIGNLEMQTPGHQRANDTIARMHEAERERLVQEIAHKRETIAKIEAQIPEIQDVYDKYNKI